MVSVSTFTPVSFESTQFWYICCCWEFFELESLFSTNSSKAIHRRKKKREEILLDSRQPEPCRMVLVSNLLCVRRLTLSGSICVSCITWSTEDTLWWILCLETLGDTLYLYSVKLGQLLCWDNPSGSSTFHLKIARKAWHFTGLSNPAHSDEIQSCTVLCPKK